MNPENNAVANVVSIIDFLPLLLAESLLLLVVLVVLPVCAICWAKSKENIELKGLALPQGSVRSMLALTIVGSFVIFLIFGATIPSIGDRFTEIVAALTGIAGTVVGFYFGSGGSGKTT